jgi:predicted nicotinamide N-methyase
MTKPRLSYQTVEFGKIDIHLCTLRNRQEFHDPVGVAESLGISSAQWPIFGVVWPSSKVLAHYISDYNTGSKRILEIGCGMALASLLLNKQHADITATDYHPEAGIFLARNALLNEDGPISYKQVAWGDTEDDLGLFDLIIGSDLLYEEQHIALLAKFFEDHSNQACEVVIVDPGRGRKKKLSARMIEFGYSSTEEKPSHTDYLSEEFKGRILKYFR